MEQDFRETTEAADVVGIGFGPAGIAFACAVADAEEEHGRSPAGSVAFFERASRPCLSPELLLPGIDASHHVFCDLVTPRNPRSRFSFAMYLKENGRLDRFTLLGRPASRLEWADYVGWTAEQLASYVHYGEPVTEILPGLVEGALTHLRIATSNGIVRTRTLVVSDSIHPRVPALFRDHLGSHVFHVSEYATRVGALQGAPFPRRWLVVGSGRSAGTATADLLGRENGITVQWLHGSSGFNPEVPAPSSDLAAAFDGGRTISSILYEGEVQGRNTFQIVNDSEVVAVAKPAASFAVTVRHLFSSDESTLEADGIVLATGYDQPRIPPLFAPLIPWLSFDENGAVAVDRDCRVKLVGATDVGIFMNALSDRAHGTGDGQSFSLVALQSERILNAIAALRGN